VKRLALAAALLVLAALPLWVGNTFYVNIATQILLYAVFALGINVLVGYAGLVTLGHAGLFGIAAYAGARMLNGGHGHAAVAAGALVAAVVVAALFAVLALRGTGLGFVMITVALGQIVWGIAYRWISITNGDNGISIKGRPSPLGLSLASPAAFYWAVLIVFVVAVASMAVSPASVAKWPPAEHPAATMNSGSPPNSPTWARAQAIAALTSVIWRGQRCCGLVRYSRERQTQPRLTRWAINACPCSVRLPKTHAPPGM